MINPPYLRMKLYFWLASFQRFLWRFRLKPGCRLRQWRGHLRPAYPIWTHYILDLVTYIERRVLSKYWRRKANSLTPAMTWLTSTPSKLNLPTGSPPPTSPVCSSSR